MAYARLRAVFMRGGTSKAVMFRTEDLPTDRKDWEPIFLDVMGSPDPNGRQLDGMGGGISSLSKICVIGPPSRPDADVDYTFAQIGVRDTFVDYGANCGSDGRAFCDKLRIRYNLESYFVPQGEGRKLEQARNERKLTVVAAVLPSGRAAIKRLMLDGEPIYQEPWF